MFAVPQPARLPSSLPALGRSHTVKTRCLPLTVSVAPKGTWWKTGQAGRRNEAWPKYESHCPQVQPAHSCLLTFLKNQTQESSS